MDINGFQEKHYIYRITNSINNKVYIGQTKNPKQRWTNYKYKSKKPEELIERAMAKYGFDNFQMHIIDQCENIDQANIKEAYYINIENSLIPNGYNVKPGGDTSPHTEETKKKISESNKGKKRSPEACKHIAEAKLGTKHSPEAKLKISEANRNRSEESRKAQGEKLKGRRLSPNTEFKPGQKPLYSSFKPGMEPHNKGKHCSKKISEEQVKEIRESDLSYKKLAEIYGCSKSFIGYLKSQRKF